MKFHVTAMETDLSCFPEKMHEYKDVCCFSDTAAANELLLLLIAEVQRIEKKKTCYEFDENRDHLIDFWCFVCFFIDL